MPAVENELTVTHEYWSGDVEFDSQRVERHFVDTLQSGIFDSGDRQHRGLVIDPILHA